MIRNLLCVLDIAEKSLNRLLLLLILKSSKFHRKTPVLEFLFNKVAGLRANFYKMESNTVIFPVKFLKFLKPPILKNIFEPLLLYLQVILFTLNGKDTPNEA